MLPWGQPSDLATVPAAAQSVAAQLDRVREICGCDGAAIYWHNEDSNILVPLTLSGQLRGVQLPVLHYGQGIVGSCFASRVPIYLDRGYETSYYAHAVAVEIGASSAFAIPLIMHEKVLGVLSGGSRKPHETDLQTRQAMETIADEIVRTFGTVAPVFVEAQVNRAEYTLVSSLIRDYATDADFDLTAARIAQVAMTLLGSDYAVLSRQEPDLSHTYHGATATRSNAWKRGMPYSTPRTREADEGLDAGDIVIVGIEEIALADSGYEHSHAEGARTVMLVPIHLNRHRIGMLIVGWRLTVAISPRLRHLAQTLAGHAAIAIAESQRPRLFSGTAVDSRRIDDSIARRLHDALARGDIFLEYQPVFDAKTGKITMFEALSRWPGAPEGYERPDQFVLFAEDRGIIGALTDYVIERAAIEWPQIEKLGARLSVNVSMRNFEEPNFAMRTLATLRKHKISPTFFGLEITETSRMVDHASAVATARKLALAGVTLSIDDFGEGYAALSYLKTFRAYALKIDRRYVANVANDTYDFSIVRSVTELAHSLGVAVVAEGIETPEALEVIKSLGCDMLQGYYCAKPMTLEQLSSTYHP